MRASRWIAWGAWACGLACSATNHSDAGVGAGGQSSGVASLSPCSPLEPTTASVKLDAASILAAGRSADGTVYVLTEKQSELRLFVTDGASIVEQFEQGTGEVNDGTSKTWLFDYAAADGSPISVEVQQDASGPRMGVLKGPKTGKTWQVGSEGETLTLLSAADAAALDAMSTQSFYVDYAGLRSDGSALVMIAPAHAADYSGYRLFWGMPSALSEEKITSFNRSLSIDGDTLVTFELGASSASLDYSFASAASDAGNSGEGSLTINGQTSSLVGSVPPVVPDGAQFLCE